MEEMWWFFIQHFTSLEMQFDSQLRSFVLMRNHFHGVIEIESADRLSWADKLEGGICDFLDQDFVLEDGIHLIRIPNIKVYIETTKYIYNNPVEAGVCQSPLDYPFSTLYELFSQDLDEKMPFMDDLGIIYDPRRMDLFD